MKYIIKDIDGQEHGPVDEATLAKWVDEDRVTAETQIRSEMLPNWKSASHVKLLEERLAEQAVRRQQVESGFEKSAELAKKFKQRFSRKTEQKTTFVHRHKPHDASMTRRLYAWIFDLMIIGAVVLMVCAGVLSYAYYHAGKVTDAGVAELRERDNQLSPQAGKTESSVTSADNAAFPGTRLPAPAVSPQGEAAETGAPAISSRKHAHDNLDADRPPYTMADRRAGYGLGSRWINLADNKEYVCLGGAPGKARWIEQQRLKRLMTSATVPLVLLVIFYYGYCYGYFAQTFGMWYWGIFVARKNIEEVYFFRAFIYTLMMFAFGIFTPLFIYVFNRGPHDLLAGVRVINVAGTTRE